MSETTSSEVAVLSHLTTPIVDIETVATQYGYPESYKKPTAIAEQVYQIADQFNLEAGPAYNFIEKVLPKLALPKGAEGWFARPKVDAIAEQLFPEITDKVEQYCSALNLVIVMIGTMQPIFERSHKDHLNKRHLRRAQKTIDAFTTIYSQQQGDIMIIPAQFGMRYRNMNKYDVMKEIPDNEFFLDAFTVACMLLTNKHRFMSPDDLGIDCPGDEFDTQGFADFKHVPNYGFYLNGVAFNTCKADTCSTQYGIATGFLPSHKN